MKILLFVCIMGLISIFDCYGQGDDKECKNLMVPSGANFMYFHLDGTPESIDSLRIFSCVGWDVCSNMNGVDWIELSGSNPRLGSYIYDYQGLGDDIVHVKCLAGIAAGPAYLNLGVISVGYIVKTCLVYRR